MKSLIDRIRHMLRVKDCRHTCLFCEFFNRCKEEYEAEAAGGGENDEHEKCNEELGHGADCSRTVDAVQRESLSGIEMAASCTERGQQEQA